MRACANWSAAVTPSGACADTRRSTSRRNQIATDALVRGFDELMWIDSDIVFLPNDVERLRAHALPFTCGIYPKKGPRQLACEFLAGTDAIRFGRTGGLTEIRYWRVRFHPHAPRGVRDGGRPTRIACLQPAVRHAHGAVLRPDGDRGPGRAWSFGEDYAFCERARRCGIPIVADTTIRLWHVGSYRYGWEDAGSPKERFADYTFHLTGTGSGVPLVPLLNAETPTRPADGDTRDPFTGPN